MKIHLVSADAVLWKKYDQEAAETTPDKVFIIDDLSIGITLRLMENFTSRKFKDVEIIARTKGFISGKGISGTFSLSSVKTPLCAGYLWPWLWKVLRRVSLCSHCRRPAEDRRWPMAVALDLSIDLNFLLICRHKPDRVLYPAPVLLINQYAVGKFCRCPEGSDIDFKNNLGTPDMTMAGLNWPANSWPRSQRNIMAFP